MSLDRLYQEVILEHQQSPRHFGRLEEPSVEIEGFNPMCGDRVLLGLRVTGDKIEAQAFEGEACSICMASASMMTEEIEGKTLSEVSQKVESFRSFIQGESEGNEFSEDVQSLSGVSRFPVRIKCALLPWMSLKDALQKLKSGDQK